MVNAFKIELFLIRFLSFFVQSGQKWSVSRPSKVGLNKIQNSIVDIFSLADWTEIWETIQNKAQFSSW